MLPPLAPTSVAPRAPARKKPFVPRAFLHRGVVLASALLVDPALLGPLEARRRIALAWAPGATVHRLGRALLLRLAAPRWIDCARAPGLPLLPVHIVSAVPADASAESALSALSAVPLEPAELAELAPLPPGAVVQMRGGALTIDRLDDASAEDPASYLDLSGVETIPVAPLGAPPPGPLFVEAKAPAETRALLGVAAPPPELTSLLESFQSLQSLHAAVARKDRRAAEASAARGRAGGGREGGQALSFFGAVFAAFAQLLSVLGGARRALLPAASSPSSGERRALASVPAPPASPSLADRLAARLRRWLASLLIQARLARLLGRRQAEYIHRLMEMFERGDLAEALRHAIPLGGKGGLPAPVALGLPSPRADLRISTGAAVAASAIFMGGDLFSELQRMYRAAFDRLEREGRLDEAAFVLAELLHESEQAVAFLERHGRLEAAAELAEARGLSPGLVVRQWFLAGERTRAVRIARRFAAFADALVRLKGHPEEPELRLLWAESLAQAGDFAAAIEVIWPVEGQRRRAAAWIEAALQQGGEAAARMLVRKLELFPETFPDILAQTLALLSDRTQRAPAERRAFADALLRGPKTPAAEVLARPAVRALVEDGARFGEPALPALVHRLATFAGDDALRTDLPGWPAVVRPLLRTLDAPRSIAIAAADTGSIAVMDVRHLPGGQTALALGEAGVRVVSRRPDGAFFHLDQPADRLVIADRGDRALGLARRGGAVRVARLDLLGRRTEVWCEALFSTGAPDFDGAEWLVADGERLLSIDTAEPRFEALRAAPLDAHALRIDRSLAGCSALVLHQGKELSHLRFELPAWTLRARKPFPLQDQEQPLARMIGVAGHASAILCETPSPPSLTLVWANEAGTARRIRLGREGEEPLALELSAGWVAVALRGKAGVVVSLLDEAELKVRAVITLAGASAACLRLREETLTVGDDRGRVLVVELIHGSVIRSLRT